MSSGLAAPSLAGAVTPAPAPPQLHVVAGSVFTLETGRYQSSPNPEGGCEALSFAAHTFSGALFGDAGTWVGGGQTIRLHFTSGPDASLVFTGQWSGELGRYRGHAVLHVYPIEAWAGLFPGATPGC